MKVATNSTGTSLFSTGDVFGTSQAITGLTTGTNYWVQVTAMNSSSVALAGTESIWTPFTTT